MRSVSALVIAASLGCAGLLARPDPPASMSWVLMPTREIQATEPIGVADVVWVAMPDDFLADGVIKDHGDIVGARATERLLPHEPVRRERISPRQGATEPRAWREPRPPVPGDDQVMVIVSARDLGAGVTIDERDLYAVQIPPRFLPEGVFLSPEHVVGRTVCEHILANEFVRFERIDDPAGGCARPEPPGKEMPENAAGP